MTRTSGATNRDPDFILYSQAMVTGRAETNNANTETLSLTLSAGDYIIDAYDFNNVNDTGATPGDACYNFTVTQ